MKTEIIIAITASAFSIIATAMLLKTYIAEERSRTEGHSDSLIKGKGWMLIDGEYVED